MTLNPDILKRMKESSVKPWKVVMLNDDKTTLSFVIEILQNVFGHNETSANLSAVLLHQAGRVIAGVYSKELAELKIQQCHCAARKQKFPLSCYLEG